MRAPSSRTGIVLVLHGVPLSLSFPFPLPLALHTEFTLLAWVKRAVLQGDCWSEQDHIPCPVSGSPESQGVVTLNIAFG